MILDQKLFGSLSFFFWIFFINKQLSTLNKFCIEEKLQLRSYHINSFALRVLCRLFEAESLLEILVSSEFLYFFKNPFTTFLTDMKHFGTCFISFLDWFILLPKNSKTSDTCWKVYCFDIPLNDIKPMHPLYSPFRNMNTLPIFLFMSNDMF